VIGAIELAASTGLKGDRQDPAAGARSVIRRYSNIHGVSWRTDAGHAAGMEAAASQGRAATPAVWFVAFGTGADGPAHRQIRQQFRHMGVTLLEAGEYGHAIDYDLRQLS